MVRTRCTSASSAVVRVLLVLLVLLQLPPVLLRQQLRLFRVFLLFSAIHYRLFSRNYLPLCPCLQHRLQLRLSSPRLSSCRRRSWPAPRPALTHPPGTPGTGRRPTCTHCRTAVRPRTGRRSPARGPTLSRRPSRPAAAATRAAAVASAPRCTRRQTARTIRLARTGRATRATRGTLFSCCQRHRLPR